MCCCCIPGLCAECCSQLRFSCCTRFKRADTDEAVVFRARVPGLTAKDVHVQVESGNLLRVVGQRDRSTVTYDGSTTITKTSQGQFVKSFKLPRNVLADMVRAEVDEEGLLTIVIPKRQ